MITLKPPRSMVPDAAIRMEVEAWQTLGLSRAGLGRFLRVAQTAVGLRGEVSVLLADDRTLRKLNRDWRGKDKATDVLSFPAHQEMAGVHAGDLAISLETARRQAQEQRHELRDEVRVLLLHGLLHLGGMDHEVDVGEMAAREAELRAKLRMKSGLIARSRFPSGMTKKKATANAKGAKDAKVRKGKQTTAKARSRFPSGMTKKIGMTGKGRTAKVAA